MKQIDFELLNKEEQIEVMYQKAVYLGKRRSGKTTILLYQLESFYIEIYYLKYRQIIRKIHCFDSTDYLGPYLEKVDVRELINC